MRRLRLPSALLALAVIVTPIVGEARPAVRCGTVVEDQAVLDRDLRCEGPALIVRNPRSVLHLNGHTVESSRSCGEGAAPSGIVIERTADGAQILGPGLVRGFVTGIAVGEAPRVQVRDVRIADSCGMGMLVVGTDGVRVRDVMLHRNGGATTDGGALRVEQSARFALEGSDVFANTSGGNAAAVDLHDCDRCRIVANRILANRGAGLRLDTESQGVVVERNVVLDHKRGDVVDQSSDGTYVLNLFERGDGLKPPSLWPAPGPPAPALPPPSGCGVMNAPVPPRATVELSCPQATGLRAARNSVVAYRLLNPINSQAFHTACDGAEVRAASDQNGGMVRCTNPDRIYPALLEITCCLN